MYFTGFIFSFIILHKYFATQEKVLISLTVDIWRLLKLHFPVLPKHANVTKGTK